MPKRILITGGSSYLGQHLLPLACKQYQVLYTYFHHKPPTAPTDGRPLDLRDFEAVGRLVSAWQPEAIIHLAGSDRSEDMSAVICQGAENIVQAAQGVNARLIHLSTDVLFDGRHGPYTESSPPSPIHPYGEAKAAAESIVAAYANHVIVRTSLIYSLTVMDYATRWLVSALESGKAVTLFDDQFRNPVWTDTLSWACLELVELDFRGILNVAGSQVLNRAEFGMRMLDWWNVQERATLSTGPSPATWPKDCRLDVSLAGQVLLTNMAGVDTVLAAHNSS
ncbi:MAG: SDR family oxidoreductase [Candidatus Promineifilaceae bacterium]